MQCPGCQFENRENAKFCKECGESLKFACSGCGTVYELGSKFCDECGYSLAQGSQNGKTEPTSDGERKHVTVLFSDLSGYTAMSEKLDPEEVKDITGRLFDGVSKIVSKYDGFIEKYAGDAVMVLFGADLSHEDDPVRAVKAAHEIHEFVESMSPRYEDKIGQPLQMHSGINTGIVVTGELNLEKGIHGVVGDTINVAARMSSVANGGEILVDHETYIRTQGYFQFENLGPVQLKGKKDAVQIHRYLSTKEQPQKIHRLHGLRAELIGRKAEIAQLSEAAENLSQGKGSIISIIGAAGTGKSRLIEEFKASLDLDNIQWREGNAYAYAQNIPYFLLIDLISKAIRIGEGDAPDKVKEKLESSLESLTGDKHGIASYIGSLYALDYPEIEDVSPEFWKAELQKSILKVLTALARRSPTVICLEDLHWADPSTIELVHFLLSEIRHPVLFLCVYRPTISSFSTHEIKDLALPHYELHLLDLSLSEAQNMVKSLLKTDTVPKDLQQFIRDKVEGNPFYLEEAINSLIESKILVPENGDWKVKGPITKTEISATIQGVIAARVDRLEQESKRTLQEASVIGRSFYYDILKRISEAKNNIDNRLGGLERFDLIKTKSIQPYLEYIFKHALTQEVVYNGLLKKERREIHERIGLTIEQLFSDRLPEFYETLAHHFSKGKSILKAADYLAKSGEKSLKRFSLDEAHQYFTLGFESITKFKNKSDIENELLIDILTRWSLVFYYRGDFIGLENLLSSQEEIANKINDKEKAAMFFAWKGFVAWWVDKFDKCREYLEKALELSESSNSLRAKGYALTWLAWLFVETGLFKKGIETGLEGNKIAKLLNDPYLYFKSLGAVSRSHFYTGNAEECLKIGKHLVDYGTKANHIRCIVMGYWNSGEGYFTAGDYASAKKSFTKAQNIAKDPFFAEVSILYHTFTDVVIDNMTQANEYINQLIDSFSKCGNEHTGKLSQTIEGILLTDAGHFSKGWEVLSNCRKYFKEVGRKTWHYNAEHIMGKIFLTIVQGEKSVGLVSMVKNANFIIGKAVFAYRLAEAHFKTAIEIADKAGATGFIGQVYLDLGILYKIKNRHELAIECLEKAVPIFEEVGAYEHLKQTNKILSSLL